MAGASATISARQPGAHLIMKELGAPANAPSAPDTNSIEHVKNLLKNDWMSALLFGQKGSLTHFAPFGKPFCGNV
jgi:hypothetical protein